MLIAKMMLRSLLLLVLTVVVLVSGIDSYLGQSCGDRGAGQTIHIAMNGSRRCCKERNCSKGTVGQMCSAKDPASTKCVPCPNNYFIETHSKSSDMLPCSLRKPCLHNRGLTIKVNGTSVSDNVCQCDVKVGYWDPEKVHDPKRCSYEECDVGNELTEEGCKPCRQRMFKSKKGIEMCSHWTDCAALGLADGPGRNITYNPGCVNETVADGTQTSPVVFTGAVAEDEQRKGGLGVGGGIGIGLTLIALILVTVVMIWCICMRPLDKEEKPNVPPGVPLDVVSPPGTYEPLTVSQRPTSLSPGCGGGHSSGAPQPYQPLVGVSDHSQTYPKQPHDATPPSPYYHKYEGGQSNGAVGSSARTYEPVINNGDSQTYAKQRCDSNLSSPSSHMYEGIDYEGMMREEVADDVEEDAEPGSDTPGETNPSSSSITVKTDKNVIKITAGTVNFQLGKDNKMTIDS